MNFFLLEDNITIVKGLKYSLEKEGHVILQCANISEALNMFTKKPAVDLAILDVSLPDGNGFSFYENTIKPLDIPAIFLTAKDEEDDIVRGLNLGAEDYITKPFSSKELTARINRILLRRKKQSEITVKDITFDTDRMLVRRGDNAVELTSLELKLCHLLFMNLNRVVSRSMILDKIWEWTGNFVDDHTVTVYFKRIREKIGSDIIITIKGVGYRIDA